MTINIGLVTNEALIFGCDSITSTSAYFIEPFGNKQSGAVKTGDQKGKPTFSINFTYDDIRPVVTNAWGGVTKMFQIHGDPSPVAAVTSGLAKLNDRTMNNLSQEFHRKQEKRKSKLVNVDVIAREFLNFIRKEYERHYQNIALPKDYWDGPAFLVGGYGRDDAFPSLYRVLVKENEVQEAFSNGNCGLAWAGQSDSVERLIRGYDITVMTAVEEEVKRLVEEQHRRTSDAYIKILNDVLNKLGTKLPDGIDTQISANVEADLPWNSGRLSIDYANLPVQGAIDFIAFLVIIQIGRDKFTSGVATVGGRTHIGLTTKANGFEMLNEPDFVHRLTGFSDDV